MEDEPNLQVVWGNLLANAADPRDLAPVSAVFPAILKELSPREVKFLDALYADIEAKARQKGKIPVGFYGVYTESGLREVYSAAGLSQTQDFFRTSDSDSRAADDLRNFSYMMAILKRHNLMTDSIWPRTVGSYDAIKNPNPKPSDIEIELNIEYSMSEIGLYFVAACNKPHTTVVT